MPRYAIIASRLPALGWTHGSRRLPDLLEQCLAPTLQPGESGHRRQSFLPQRSRVTAAVERCGAQILHLPPYSPDSIPSNCLRQLKAHLRTATARTSGPPGQKTQRRTRHLPPKPLCKPFSPIVIMRPSNFKMLSGLRLFKHSNTEDFANPKLYAGRTNFPSFDRRKLKRTLRAVMSPATAGFCCCASRSSVGFGSGAGCRLA